MASEDPPEDFPFYEAVQQVIGDANQYQQQHYPQVPSQTMSMPVPNPQNAAQGLSMPIPTPTPPIGPLATRGVAYALYVKNNARNEFKARRRQELVDTGNSARIQRHRRNDTSLNAHEKYVRRLRKNQDSAAAARHAHEAYVGCLEEQAASYDTQVSAAQQELAVSLMERDKEANLLQHNQTHHSLVLQELQEVRRDVEALEHSIPYRPPPAM